MEGGEMEGGSGARTRLGGQQRSGRGLTTFWA